MIIEDQADIKRFWSKVDKSGEHWLWTGTTVHGHGSFGVYKNHETRMYYAHRISYELAYGEIPDGLFVLHKPVECNIKLCVRDIHLYAGTHGDNMRDRGSDAALYGSASHFAILTEEQVLEIRHIYATTPIGMTKLSKRFGVGLSTIHNILHRNTWTHI